MAQTGWLTVREQIRLELRKPTTAATEIARAMCEAIEWLGQFDFTAHSQADFSFVTAPDVYQYGPGDGAELPEKIGVPEDLAGIVGPHLWMDRSSTSTRIPIPDRTVDFVEGRVNMTRAWRGYAWWNEQLLISPVPTSIETIRGRYLRDLGAPIYQWNGSAWKVYHPNGTTEMNQDTYTSVWVERAVAGTTHASLADLVRYRALYILWSGLYAGEDGSAGYASQALRSMLEKKAELDNRSQKRQTNRTIRGYL